MSGSKEDLFWLAFAVLVFGFLALSFIFTSLGFGSARGQSTYTGYVVDAEIDKGLLFRTSTVHLKTHPRASAVEEFCLPTDEFEKQASTYLQDQQRVKVTYSRPYWVHPMTCSGGLSLVRSFEEVEPVEGDSVSE